MSLPDLEAKCGRVTKIWFNPQKESAPLSSPENATELEVTIRSDSDISDLRSLEAVGNRMENLDKIEIRIFKWYMESFEFAQPDYLLALLRGIQSNLNHLLELKISLIGHRNDNHPVSLLRML